MLSLTTYNNTTYKKNQAQNWLKKNWDKDEKYFLSQLDFMIVNDLKKSSLTIETVISARIDRFSGNADDLKSILGFANIDKQSIIQACSILQIPYYLKGKIMQNYCRVRLYPELSGVKYLSPLGSTPIPYILPQVYSIKDKKNKEIWITEGEKKALKLVQDGEYCIGLSGVWNFRAGKDSDDTTQNKELFDDIREFVFNGRTFYIAYDADFIQNPDVRKALFSLAITLLNLGAIVKIATWDGSKGKGIDDYLAGGGDIVEVKQNSSEILNFIEQYKEFADDALSVLKNINLNDILKTKLQATFKKVGILKKVFDSFLYKPEPPKSQDSMYGSYTIPAPYKNVDNMLCIVHSKIDMRKGEVVETYEAVCPFFIIKNTIKANDSVELTLEFADKTIIIDASGIGDSKKLAEQFNNAHVFITNRNAKTVADYIVNFMRLNPETPRIIYVSETGWNADNSIFYAPTVFINDTVKYSDDLSDKITKKGNKDKQIELIKEIFNKNTGVSIVCLAGLASALLKPIGLDNLVFYVRGLTGAGKTLSNLIMLSMFGNPSKLKNIMNTTITGTEIMLSKQKDIPILLDELETSGMKAEQTHNFIINLIYNFQSGTGRTRAQRNLSLRETVKYRGILFLTGERSINSILTANTSEKANLGIYRRTLELNADDISLFSDTVNFSSIAESINKNYGYILPDWVSYLGASNIVEKYNNFKANFTIENIGGKQDIILLMLFCYFKFIKLFNIDYNKNIITAIQKLFEYNKKVYNDEVADPIIEKEKYLNSIKEFALKSGSFIDKTNTDDNYRSPQRIIGQIESDDDVTYYYYTISAFKEFCNNYNYEKERVINSLNDNIEKKGKYLYYPKCKS
jgi:uncharacterized protein (DUF927 family)